MSFPRRDGYSYPPCLRLDDKLKPLTRYYLSLEGKVEFSF